MDRLPRQAPHNAYSVVTCAEAGRTRHQVGRGGETGCPPSPAPEHNRVHPRTREGRASTTRLRDRLGWSRQYFEVAAAGLKLSGEPILGSSEDDRPASHPPAGRGTLRAISQHHLPQDARTAAHMPDAHQDLSTGRPGGWRARSRNGSPHGPERPATSPVASTAGRCGPAGRTPLGSVAANDRNYARILGPWREFRDGISEWHGLAERSFLSQQTQV